MGRQNRRFGAYGVTFARYVAVSLVLLCSGLLYFGWYMERPTTSTEIIALPSIDDVPVEQLQKIGEVRIFFAHRSVGRDIMQGIEEVAAERSLEIRIIEGADGETFAAPVFAHTLIGRNGDPDSKISDFALQMRSGTGERADIAFMKFCYLDIHDATPVQGVFDTYEATLGELRQEFPGTTLLSVTAPLRSWPEDLISQLKMSVKFLLQRSTVVDDNEARDSYNGMLKAAALSDGDVFDLATIESVDPEGRQHLVKRGDDIVPMMFPGYTDDGGHLNQAGRKHVAEQFLIFLAQRLQRSTNSPGAHDRPDSL